MRKYREKGFYGEDDVYVIEYMEDWDKYAEILGQKTRFFELQDDFYKFIGKFWSDGKNKYKVIGLEDNNPCMDWYWVLQNVNDENDIRTELVNDPDFKKRILFNMLSLEPKQSANNITYYENAIKDMVENFNPNFQLDHPDNII